MPLLEVVDGDGHGFVMVMSGYVDMKNGMEIYVLRGIAVQPYFNLFAESAQGVDPLHLFSNSYSILSSEIRKNVSSPEAERYFEYSTSTKNATYSHLAPKNMRITLPLHLSSKVTSADSQCARCKTWYKSMHCNVS